MRMTIGKKLGWGFGAVLILTIGAGLYGGISYLNTAHVYSEYTTIRIEQACLVHDIQVEFKKQVQEWKDILLRGYNPEDFKEYKEKFYKQREKVEEVIEKLKSRPYGLTSEESKKRLEEFTREYKALQEDYAEALKIYTAGTGGNYKEADKRVRGKDRAPTDIVDKIVDAAMEDTHQKSKLVRKQAMSTGIIIGIVLFFASIVSMIIRVLISRSISVPILKLRNGAAEIGAGKLDTRVDIKSNDELGDLANAFNKMSSDLQNNQEEMQVQNEELNTSNEELKSSNEEIATTNEELRVATEELRQTNEELVKLKTELEKKVEERMRETTEAKQALEKKVLDLERFNKLAVGRELMMKELKEKISQLEQKLKEKS